MDDLVDYLRDNLKAATDPVCGCPDLDATTINDHIRGDAPQTIKGYDHACPVHGRNGTEPLIRRSE